MTASSPIWLTRTQELNLDNIVDHAETLISRRVCKEQRPEYSDSVLHMEQSVTAVSHISVRQLPRVCDLPAPS